CAPDATAACTAARVRSETVSSSSSRVPSTSVAISAGSVIARSFPSPRLALGALAGPLGQFGLVEPLGLGRRGRGAAEPPWHPVHAVRVRVTLLGPVQQ